MPLITRRFLPVGVALLVASPAFGAVALASGPAVEERGADLLTAVERGESACAGLDSSDFKAVGEFAMGRMLGSPRAHEAMDETMARMMGGSGLDRMHEMMGQRLAGCAAPGANGGYGGMLGMMSMMGGGAGGMMGGGGMMSAQGGQPGSYGPGAMMGYDRGGDDDDNGPGAWMAIVMLVIIVGAGVAVFAIARPGGASRGGSTPLDVLAARFARGELSAEDYEQRRRLLEGET